MRLANLQSIIQPGRCIVEKKRMRNRLKNAQPTQEIYLLWRNFLFRGGYVHANASMCNDVLSYEDDMYATSLDLKSAHPGQMLLERFPWKFNRVNRSMFPEVSGLTITARLPMLKAVT